MKNYYENEVMDCYDSPVVNYDKLYYDELTEDDWHALRGNSERRYADVQTVFGRLLAKAGEEFRVEEMLDYWG